MCGIFGIHGHPRAKEITEKAAWSVRSRGKGSIGIAAIDPKRRQISIAKKVEYTKHVFKEEKFAELQGKTYIAHVRWPTEGEKSTRNAQPHYTQDLSGRVAISTNGDIRNITEVMDFINKNEIRVYSDNDAEMMSAIIYYFIDQGQSIFEAIASMKKIMKGAYSVLFIADWEDALYAFRDDWGIRPMLLGYLDNRYVVCSETCQLDKIGANFIREIYPGEILKIDDHGLSWPNGRPEPKTSGCAFCTVEDLYFSRPDSYVYVVDEQGKLKIVSYSQIRYLLGKALAEEQPVPNADFVAPIPRSGIPAAEGYAAGMGIPCEHVIVTEGDGADVGRTFIESEQSTREALAKIKYSIIKDRVKGKVIVVVDDSEIRGLTAMVVAQMLMDAGAKEVHIRIPSPRYRHSCHYGVDTKKEYELIAKDLTLEEQRFASGRPTSLAFLSVEAFVRVLLLFHPAGLCTSCFTGIYPV